MARWRKTLKMDFSDCEIKTIVEWTWNKKKKKKKTLILFRGLSSGISNTEKNRWVAEGRWLG